MCQIVRMLEDSAKEVRESAMLALEKFYAAIGSSLMVNNSLFRIP